MKKKILLIEDDLLTCRACEERLREMGYEIDLALDGEEGVVGKIYVGKIENLKISSKSE